MNTALLIGKYGYWGEHPDHNEDAWRYLVANGDERRGYWEWVVHRIKDGE